MGSRGWTPRSWEPVRSPVDPLGALGTNTLSRPKPHGPLLGGDTVWERLAGEYFPHYSSRVCPPRDGPQMLGDRQRFS